MKHHVWKIFQFTGWFVVLVGVIFALLFASISLGRPFIGSIFLIVLGAIGILIGEYLIEAKKDHTLHMVFQALSIGGAFALTVGLIWLIIQFLETYQNAYAVAVIIAIGIVLVIAGEALKIQKKK